MSLPPSLEPQTTPRGYPVPMINTSFISIRDHEAINEKDVFPKAMLDPLQPERYILEHLNTLQSSLVKEVILSEKFIQASSLRFQAMLLQDRLRADEDHPLCTHEELAKVLGLKHAASFRQQIIMGKKEPHQDGRPRLIHKQAEDFIMKVVVDRYVHKDSISI
jgi:hypothetical protein